MGRVGPIPSLPSPLLPAAQISKPFPSPRNSFWGNFGKSRALSPASPSAAGAEGGICLPPKSSALCGAHGRCHESPDWFRDINFTISLERFQSKGLCDMITRGELSCIV